MNMSRLFTLLGRQSGYQGVLPVGRVQTRRCAWWWTATAASPISCRCRSGPSMCSWKAQARCSMPNGARRRRLRRPGPLPATGVGAAGRRRHAGRRHGAVLKVATERVREAAPLPFDLGTLQELCSKKFGLGAQETLDIAQALYETHKLITYPRSDCGYLPLSQHGEAPAILAALQRADASLAPLQRTWSPSAAHGRGTTPRSAPTTASSPPPPPATRRACRPSTRRSTR
jgi:DNA topoisomerase-3